MLLAAVRKRFLLSWPAASHSTSTTAEALATTGGGRLSEGEAQNLHHGLSAVGLTRLRTAEYIV